MCKKSKDNLCKKSKEKPPSLFRWVLSIQIIGFIVLGVVLCILYGKSSLCSAYTSEHIVCSVCFTVIICLFMLLHTILTLKIIGYEFDLKSHWIEFQSEKKKGNNTVNQQQGV